MTTSPNDRPARDRAQAAIQAALSRAAAAATAAGVRPSALIAYGEGRIAALLRSAPADAAPDGDG